MLWSELPRDSAVERLQCFQCLESLYVHNNRSLGPQNQHVTRNATGASRRGPLTALDAHTLACMLLTHTVTCARARSRPPAVLPPSGRSLSRRPRRSIVHYSSSPADRARGRVWSPGVESPVNVRQIHAGQLSTTTGWGGRSPGTNDR